MGKYTHAIIGLFVMMLTLTLVGCNDEYADKKEVMKAEWETASAKAKMSAIEDMIERGEIPQARQMLQQCYQVHRDNPNYYLLLGRVDFIEEQNQQARTCFEKAVELDGELAEGWYHLAVLAVLDKAYDLAIEYYKIICALEPGNAEYVVSMSDVLVETGHVEQAVERLEKSLQAQPQALDVLMALAKIKRQSGQTDQAVRLYEQAFLLNPESPSVLEACGYTYVSMQKWDKAAEKFELLLKQCQSDQPHYTSVMHSLAMCAFNAGNYGRALDCYDELSVLSRDDAKIWIGMAQSALGVDNFTRAIHCANRALQLKPGWSKAQAVLGSAYYLKGDYEQSLNSFQCITGDKTLGGFAWFMTGRCYQSLGYSEQANTAYKRAEQFDPENELMKMFLKKNVQSL